MTSKVAMTIAIGLGALAPLQVAKDQQTVPIPTPAQSENDPLASGGAFLKQCERAIVGQGPPETFGICFGFLDGVIARDGGLAPHLICIPRGANRAKIMSAALERLSEDQSLQDMPGRSAVLLALAKAFPNTDSDVKACFQPWQNTY